jgi:hypothetical protein
MKATGSTTTTPSKLLAAGLALVAAVAVIHPAAQAQEAAPSPTPGGVHGLKASASTGGAVRLSEPTAADAWAQVGKSVEATAGAYGFTAEARSHRLRGREATLRLEFLGDGDEVLASFRSGRVFGDRDWTPMVGYGVAPEGSRRVRLLLALEGEGERGRGTAAGWAEFRNPRLSPAPRVTVKGPRHGVVTAGRSLSVTLSVGDTPEGVRWSARLLDLFGRILVIWEAPAGKRHQDFQGLPPGYYELDWRLDFADGAPPVGERERFAVLDGEPRPSGSPFAVDAGLSLAAAKQPGAAADLARLLDRIGLVTVRDRLRTAAAFPEAGTSHLDAFVRAARAQGAAGLTVDQVVHDLPPWMSAAPDQPRAAAAAPEDLRQLYGLFEQAARELGPEVAYWEVWNEPDVDFFAGRPEEFAGMLKAAYLGVKKGNPAAEVLLGGVAGPPGPWLDRLFAAGAADYYDLFNWHSYRPYATIADDAEAFRGLQQRHGVDLPQWLTETGDPTGPGLAAEREQAALYVKRTVVGLDSGVEKVFPFYLFPYRRPGEDGFGLLDDEERPLPALPVLAAMTRMLGRGAPLGHEAGPGAGLWWFDSGEGPVAVTWSDEEVDWPASLAAAKVRDLSGNPLAQPTKLGPEPVYLAGMRPPDSLVAPPRPPRRRRAAEDLDRLGLVVDLRVQPAADGPLSSRQREEPVGIVPGDRLPAQLALYNFSSRPAAVTLDVEVPKGWRVEGGAEKRTVAPGDRQVLPLTVRVGKQVDLERTAWLRVTASAPGFTVAPTAAALAADRERLPWRTVRSLLSGAKDRGLWSAHSTAEVGVTLDPEGAGGGLRLAFTSSAEGGGWGFAAREVAGRDHLSRGQGLRLTTAAPRARAAALVVDLETAAQETYRAFLPAAEGQPGGATRVLLWSDFSQVGGEGAGKRLDPAAVRQVAVGVQLPGPGVVGPLVLGPVEVVKVGR